MEEEKKEKGLTITTVWFMIAVALFYDALQWLLVWIFMSWIVTPLFYLTFWLWFKTKGLNFFSLKRAKMLGAGAIIELIPGLDALPSCTFMVARIALDLKIQEVAPGMGVTKLGIGNVTKGKLS